jgi:hypothetical protein
MTREYLLHIHYDGQRHCAFCPRGLVIQWTGQRGESQWACLWHTRRAWRALKAARTDNS